MKMKRRPQGRGTQDAANLCIIKFMVMTKKREIYRCPICGNIVEVLHEGAELSCCGKPMELQNESVMDAGHEKHVPVVEQSGDVLHVKVGSVEHPMTKEHYIQWIELLMPKCVMRQELCPGDRAEAVFPNLCGLACEDGGIVVRAYCNMHGLWRK